MIDATSGLDRCDSKIFRIVTPSPGGAMPLETLIVSSEWQDILVKAFEMYKSLLPSYAFHGRGRNGPVCFLTDNCQAEYESFIQVFPSSEHLLCQFHLLQAIWRWIWAAIHKIENKDRKELINAFRSLVYAKNEDDFLSKLESFEVTSHSYEVSTISKSY